MTIFDEEEPGFVNVVSADEAAFSPRAGFLSAFSNAYDLQAKAWGQFSLEVALRDHEQEMFRRIRAAGAEPPPSLNDTEDTAFLGGAFNVEGLAPGFNSQRYLDLARLLGGEDPGSPDLSSVVAERNERLRELGRKYPSAGIKTYDELFADVRADAAAAEERAERTPLSFGGFLGDFLGGAAGSMRPSTDPLNFATIGVGGAGKSVATRIGTEGGAQGAIETINQFTGVQENRQLLGLNYGLSQAAMQIGMTAAGGAALRATGEAAAAGVRRWFNSTSADPAPRPEVIETSDALPAPGRRERLEAPDQVPLLEAPRHRLPGPATSRAAPEAPRVDFGRYISEETYRQVRGADSRLGRKRVVDDIAAVADQLDDFEGPIPANVRPSVDTSAAGKPGTAHTRSSEAFVLVDEGASISARHADPDAFRVRANLERRLDKVMERIEREVSEARKAADSLKAAEAAEAHVRAENKPFVDKLERRLESSQAGVERAEAVSEGRFPRQPGDEAPEPAPAAQRTPEAAPDVRNDSTTAQARRETTEIHEATQHATKVVDDAVDGFRASVGRLLADEGGEIHLPSGKKLDLDGDSMVVPTKDGEGTRTLTVRQALQELQEDEDILRAVNTCSLPSRS